MTHSIQPLDDLTGTDAPFLWGIVADDGSVLDRFASEAEAKAALPNYQQPFVPEDVIAYGTPTTCDHPDVSTDRCDFTDCEMYVIVPPAVWDEACFECEKVCARFPDAQFLTCCIDHIDAVNNLAAIHVYGTEDHVTIDTSESLWAKRSAK